MDLNLFDLSPTGFILAVSFAILAITVIVFLFAGHALRSNKRLHVIQKKLKAMTTNFSAAEERERKRIAEDLHDRIGETVVLSNRSLEALKKKLKSEDASQDLDELNQIIRELVKGTRSLIFDLVPRALYDIGLEAAVEDFAINFGKQYKIKIKVEDDGQPKPLDTDVSVFLYKAIREFILNVVKHAGANMVVISLVKMNDDYWVVVEDNGIGFRADFNKDQTKNEGYGLFNIQIQAEHYGGYLEVDTSLTKGGRVLLTVPLKK